MASKRRTKMAVQRVVVEGKRMVMLHESTFESLLRKADLWEPEMPKADAAGNFPALEALAVLQARDILRARRNLGVTQADLARAAGIRIETLNRVERGKHKPSIATMGKIDRALTAMEARNKREGN
jgi:DNA-binding XRE family transcriptional regulator